MSIVLILCLNDMYDMYDFIFLFLLFFFFFGGYCCVGGLFWGLGLFGGRVILGMRVVFFIIGLGFCVVSGNYFPKVKE